MTYLIALAADLLHEPDATLAVAQEVGYGGPFATCSAFKRASAISSQQCRALSVASER